MVVVKFQGGLGNQMFQYSAAMGTGISNILFDFVHLKKVKEDNEHATPRSFELGIFPDLKGIEISHFQSRILKSNKFLVKVLRDVMYSDLCIVKQENIEWIDIPRSKHLILDGFFQSELYFDNNRNGILKAFSFPALDVKNMNYATRIKEKENSISLHIRRGDYLKAKFKDFHGVLPLSYYKDAIAKLNAITKTPFYWIFSDDPVWCEENLREIIPDFEIIQGNYGTDAWKDMALMTMCRHAIIANSSFSWWGAWLNNNPDKVIVAPQNWFANSNINDQAHNLIPAKWIRI